MTDIKERQRQASAATLVKFWPGRTVASGDASIRSDFAFFRQLRRRPEGFRGLKGTSISTGRAKITLQG